MKKYIIKEHFLELRRRFFTIFISFIFAFIISYCFSDYIYNFILNPLVQQVASGHKVIYTGMTEAFLTYLKLSLWAAFLIVIPVILTQLYLFIIPGLLRNEKTFFTFIIIISPLLFYLGIIWGFYWVIPYAWHFFLSFENHSLALPITLEIRISEYLNIVIQLTIAFGLAFEFPIAVLLMSILGLVSTETLKNNRRFAIVAIFFIAAILTPPDVISQIALAIPMILLYEVSIIACNFVEKRKKK